jgi:hypothetical protein
MNAPTITPEQVQAIRRLDDFDLCMFLDELHDFGWPDALDLLPMMEAAAMVTLPTHKGGTA